jgi:hypothetical protein
MWVKALRAINIVNIVNIVNTINILIHAKLCGGRHLWRPPPGVPPPRGGG